MTNTSKKNKVVVKVTIRDIVKLITTLDTIEKNNVIISLQEEKYGKR